jgi:hypothetical protein
MNENLVSTNSAHAQAAFIQWLRGNYPNLYQRAMSESGLRLGDFASAISNIFGTIKDTVAKLAPVYVQTRAEMELLKINIARAKAGQMPVNSAQEAADEASGYRGSGFSFASIPPVFLYGGLALLAFFLFKRMR